MRIVVTGADGQLGHELCRQLPGEAIPLCERDVDLRFRGPVHDAIRRIHPDAVINTAAYTNVDGAESQADLCFAVNAEGPRHLSEICQETKSVLVQISTDYVFDGPTDRRHPFREDESPNPHGVYAKSKLAGEQYAADCPRSLIVRTCGLYVHRTAEPDVRNFPKSILKAAQTQPELRVVSDQRCTPSYVPHVATAIMRLLRAECFGTYHVVNRGATTWYEFACELIRQANLDVPVIPIRTDEYPMSAKRPACSVLDTAKYAAACGDHLPIWQAGITEFLRAWMM